MADLEPQEMGERIAALMADRLGTGGQGLAEKLRRDGRRLPRRIRAEADYLVTAAELARHPRTCFMVDTGRLRHAHDLCHRHLSRIGRGRRLRRGVLDALGVIVLSLVVVAVGLIAVARWRGLL